jgi:hypothetical protein
MACSSVRVAITFAAVLGSVCLGFAPRAEAKKPLTMFGGQLVRSTTLDGALAVELGGGGALYVKGTPLYWGGGGGSVFQIGEAGDLELFHGELLLGYDLWQRSSTIVSAMGLVGVGMTKGESGVFGLGEGRLAVRQQLSHWFMVGLHLAYRRAVASDHPEATDAALSGPVLGLELYFTL